MNLSNAINTKTRKVPNELNISPIRILVVENYNKLSDDIRNNIEQDYSIKSVIGRDARKEVLNTNPDFIISEIMLFDIDGVELCRRIKGNSTISHIPLILMSSNSTVEQKIEGLSAGADGFVEKPFEIEYLTALIDNLLLQRKKLSESFAVNKNLSFCHPLNVEREKTFVEKVDAIIEENISNPDFSLEHIISAVYMSRSQVFRKFKHFMKKNPGEYVRKIRLEHAAKLLNQRKFNVNEIAGLTGFGNTSNFITCFKKHYGITPKKYIETQTLMESSPSNSSLIELTQTIENKNEPRKTIVMSGRMKRNKELLKLKQL